MRLNPVSHFASCVLVIHRSANCSLTLHGDIAKMKWRSHNRH